MKVIGFYSALLLTCIGQIECGEQETVPLAECELIPLTLYDCENVEPLFRLSVELRNKDDEGNKFLDAEVDITEELTEESQFIMDVDQWDKGSWNTDVYNGKGGFGEYAKRYAERGFEKVRSEVSPALEDPYNWPVGSYVLKNFTLQPSDLDIPASAYGRFRVTLQLFNLDGELLICNVLEIEINAKEKDK